MFFRSKLAELLQLNVVDVVIDEVRSPGIPVIINQYQVPRNVWKFDMEASNFNYSEGLTPFPPAATLINSASDELQVTVLNTTTHQNQFWLYCPRCTPFLAQGKNYTVSIELKQSADNFQYPDNIVQLRFCLFLNSFFPRTPWIPSWFANDTVHCLRALFYS